MTQMASRSRADFSVVIMHGAQIVFENRSADGTTQGCAGVLIGSEMNAAIDAGVGNVVGDLAKSDILQDDAGHRRVR